MRKHLRGIATQPLHFNPLYAGLLMFSGFNLSHTLLTEVLLGR